MAVNAAVSTTAAASNETTALANADIPTAHRHKRKGKLNECHTEQDTQAGKTANNKAQHATQIPIPTEMWNITDEEGKKVTLEDKSGGLKDTKLDVLIGFM